MLQDDDGACLGLRRVVLCVALCGVGGGFWGLGREWGFGSGRRRNPVGGWSVSRVLYGGIFGGLWVWQLEGEGAGQWGVPPPPASARSVVLRMVLILTLACSSWCSARRRHGEGARILAGQRVLTGAPICTHVFHMDNTQAQALAELCASDHHFYEVVACLFGEGHQVTDSELVTVAEYLEAFHGLDLAGHLGR